MFRPGDQIGSFSLLQKIGRGAFGEVWLAEEKTAITAHRVALKLPNEEVIDIEAIRQEASVWESVKGHPNILPIIKADIIDDQIYIASEYAPDGSLSTWLKIRGGKAPDHETAVRLTKGILAGLVHLHSKEVIHRDLKPENILLQSETPRIADFGIARLVKSATSSTQVTGTPAYMAPECYYSVRSAQTDVWAAGVIFYLLLSGQLPFPQPDQISIMNAILNSEPPIEHDIPCPFQGIIRKALQKDPARRYGSAGDMLGDLNMIGVETLVNEGDMTVDLTPLKYSDTEQETVVSFKGPPKENPSVHINFFKIGTILAATILVLGLGTYWAATRFGKNENLQWTNSNTNGGPTAGMAPVQPVDSATGASEGRVLESGTAPNSNTAVSHGILPGGDGYNVWANGTTPPPGGPGGQVITVDPNGMSPFSPDDGSVILVPIPADPKPPPTPTPRKTPPPSDVILVPLPISPEATPPKTRPDARPWTDATPPPVKTPAPANKKAPSGKPQDS